MLKLVSLSSVLAACTISPSHPECENTLTLRDEDQGATHAIEDGCTSLIVSLQNDPPSDWAATPVVSTDALRFDYRFEGAGTVEYYFTPMRDGEAQVKIAHPSAGESWLSTIRVSR